MQVRRYAAIAVLAVTATAVLTLNRHEAAEPGSTEPRPVAAAVASQPRGTDVLFAQMMVLHHEQAVRMSRALVAKPGVPERLRLIADFIAHDQQREIDEMNGWLTAWGLPGAEAGAHTDHGMLTEEQLRQLDTAAFPAAGPLFLEQMTEHHRGAVLMARSLLDTGGANAYLHGVAKHVINEQTAEIDAMQRLIREGTP
ncbi:DUF305 domain-containing protein [Actinoplanes sp. NPDC051494]|uniref:DUF305 domain-containing protein n=1 Tax=Actinoplanes sp. NPDC051494 TaxID=3363907 RepID=UPI00379B03DD